MEEDVCWDASSSSAQRGIDILILLSLTVRALQKPTLLIQTATADCYQNSLLCVCSSVCLI